MYVDTAHLTEDAYAKWFIQFSTILVEPVVMDRDKEGSGVKCGRSRRPRS